MYALIETTVALQVATLALVILLGFCLYRMRRTLRHVERRKEDQP